MCDELIVASFWARCFGGESMVAIRLRRFEVSEQALTSS